MMVGAIGVDVTYTMRKRLAQQEEEEKPLLVGLCHAPAAAHETIECHRRDDDHRLVLEVEAHASHTAGRLRWRRSKISYRCSLLRSDRFTVWFPSAAVSIVLTV